MQVTFYGRGISRTGKIIRWLALSTSSAVLFLSLASCSGLFNSEDSLSIADIEARIFKLVNDHRLSIGRSALVWSDVLAAEERIHSQNMATGQVPVGHAGFDARAERVNVIIPWSVIAENVAFASSVEDAFDAWLKSPEHQVIVEGDFDLSGVGAAKNTLGPFYYYSQMFLKRL